MSRIHLLIAFRITEVNIVSCAHLCKTVKLDVLVGTCHKVTKVIFFFFFLQKGPTHYNSENYF